MYRIARIMENGKPCCLTRSRKTRPGYQPLPVWADNPADRRIITYGTKWGALQRMMELLKEGYSVVVFDAATGKEIEESVEARA